MNNELTNHNVIARFAEKNHNCNSYIQHDKLAHALQVPLSSLARCSAYRKVILIYSTPILLSAIIIFKVIGGVTG